MLQFLTSLRQMFVNVCFMPTLAISVVNITSNGLCLKLACIPHGLRGENPPDGSGTPRPFPRPAWTYNSSASQRTTAAIIFPNANEIEAFRMHGLISHSFLELHARLTITCVCRQQVAAGRTSSCREKKTRDLIIDVIHNIHSWLCLIIIIIGSK